MGRHTRSAERTGEWHGIGGSHQREISGAPYQKRYRRDKPSAAVAGAAIFANTVNLECVAGGQIVISAADFLLKLSNFLRKEFDRTAAFRADHVVMAAAVVLMLIARNAVVKSNFGSEAAFGKKLQRAIDSGVADPGVLFLDETVKFVGRKMVPGLEKSAENRVALRRLLKADLLQVTMKDVLSLANHLA